MAYSMDPLTADCYSGTAVLLNKLGIRNDSELAEAEAEIVSVRIAEWSRVPLVATFDFEHYKAVHRYLFGDLYDWAGQVRTVNLAKKGTHFCPAEKIEEQGKLIFDRLQRLGYLRGMEHGDFVEELTDFYCSTNELHPFREGNGRTQRVFLSQLARNAGYSLNFSEVDGDLLMIATIQSAQGVRDLLKQILSEAVRFFE